MTDSQSLSLSLSLNDDNLHREIATHLRDVGQVLNENIAELDRQDELNKDYIRQLNQIDQYLVGAESALTSMKEKHLAELKHSEEQAKLREEQAKQREEQAKLREAFIQQQIDSIERHLQQSQTELNRATEILRTMKNIQTEKSE